MMTENWFPPNVMLVVYWMFEVSFRTVVPLSDARRCSRGGRTCLPCIPSRTASARSIGSARNDARMSERAEGFIFVFLDAPWSPWRRENGKESGQERAGDDGRGHGNEAVFSAVHDQLVL